MNNSRVGIRTIIKREGDLSVVLAAVINSSGRLVLSRFYSTIGVVQVGATEEWEGGDGLKYSESKRDQVSD